MTAVVGGLGAAFLEREELVAQIVGAVQGGERRTAPL
jgi:hypothetical protein